MGNLYLFTLATNFVGKIDLQSTLCSSLDIRYGVATAYERKRKTIVMQVAGTKKLPNSMDAGELIK